MPFCCMSRTQSKYQWSWRMFGWDVLIEFVTYSDDSSEYVTNSIRVSHHNCSHDHISRTRSVIAKCHGKLNSAMGWLKFDYGVATISRLLKIIGLFCRIWSLLQGSFAKETHDFKEPTNRSHPISPNITNTRGLIRVCHELNQIISSQYHSWPHITNCHEKNRLSPNITNTRGLIRLCHELYQDAKCHDHISRTVTKKFGYHQILPKQEDWSDYVTNSITMPNVMTTYHELLRKNSAITKYNRHNVCRHQT